MLNLRFDEDLLTETINKDLLFELTEKTKVKALLHRIKILTRVYKL